MVKYLLEDTRLISFLITNGPKVLERPEPNDPSKLKDALVPEANEANTPSTPEAKKVLQLTDAKADKGSGSKSA